MAIDINALSDAYDLKQGLRINRIKDQINSQAYLIKAGRLIPEINDLKIGNGRLLDASVMFLDICKFSSRKSVTREDQDLLLRILNLFFSEMITTVEDYGGVVEKNTGDGLMAYFVNTPLTPNQVRQRAIACALTMFHGAAKFINPILSATPVLPLTFRICIDHGQVTVARVGAAQRFNNIVAVGSTANIASKMLNFAKDDQLWLGENMISGLPQSWLPHVELRQEDTGWTFAETGQPYRFWEFTGRWNVN